LEFQLIVCFLYVSVHEEAGEVLCAYYDEEDCRFKYVYTYSDNNTLIVRAQEERECPPEIYVLGVYLTSCMP
jgi:protocadherin alpha